MFVLNADEGKTLPCSARHLQSVVCLHLEGADMERNDDRATGGYGDTGDFTGSQGYGAGTGGANVGGTASNADQTEGQGHGHGIAERARDLAGTGKDRLADVGSTVRDKAGQAKNSLVGALEAGADRLRQRAHGSGQLAGTTGDGSVSVSDQGRLAPVADKVAGGMQATADWLRDADLDNLKSGIERQVKEHPGRSLLIALGLGYVIGKAFRNR
jgi:hypothetical protein